MSRVAVIAALPREIAGVVKGFAPDAAWLPRGVHLYRLPDALVVAAGMGSERATVAVQAALEGGDVNQLISAGLAGACSSAVQAGEVVSISAVIDAKTGERFATEDSGSPHALVSTSGIATVHEKARLAASYGAAAVDMEAATVARLARAHGIPFRATKGISDAHDFELASLSRFAGRHGTFRTGAFALHTALRPQQWRHAVHLGHNSARALAALQQRLRDVLAERA